MTKTFSPTRFVLALLALTVLAILLVPFLAFAQADAGIAPVLADPTDIHQMAALVLNAVMQKQWGLLASLATLITVASLRKYVPEKTKVGAWFRTRLGGIVMAFVTTASGAFATAFLAGAPFSLDMVLKVLSVTLAASGGWAIFKNVRDAIDEKKAMAAGTDAVKVPNDTINQ